MKRAELRALVAELQDDHPEVTIRLHPRLVVPDTAHPNHKFFQVEVRLRGIVSSIQIERDIEIGQTSLGSWVETEIPLLMHLAADESDLVIRAMRLLQSAAPSRVAFARHFTGYLRPVVSPTVPPSTVRAASAPGPSAPSPDLPTLWERLDESEDS